MYEEKSTCQEMNTRVGLLLAELHALLEWDELFWDSSVADEIDVTAHETRARRRIEIFQELIRLRRTCGSQCPCYPELDQQCGMGLLLGDADPVRASSLLVS